MSRLLLVGVNALVLRTSTPPSLRLFGGATNHAGRITATAAITATNGTIRVGVAVSFEATTVA